MEALALGIHERKASWDVVQLEMGVIGINVKTTSYLCDNGTIFDNLLQALQRKQPIGSS